MKLNQKLMALLTVSLLLGGASGCSSGDALPLLTASAPFVDFGEARLGSSVEAQVSLSNVGTAAAELALPTIVGDGAGAFIVAGEDWPLLIEAGSAADLDLRFSPSVLGVSTASMELVSAISGTLSGGVGSGSPAGFSVPITLVGLGVAAGDDDDSASDDDDSASDDDDTGDDDTAGDDDDTAGDDDDTAGDDDDTAGDDDDELGLDQDGDGYSAESAGGSDCDDSDPTVSPAGLELCDGVDNDCDGDVDDDPIDGATWYLDSDSDGYGGQLLAQEACAAPASYVDNSDDCDDLVAAVYPGATELCNERDDDCDGVIDDNAPAAQTWYLDNDGDGVGGFWLTQEACQMPTGYAPDSSDCDDTNPLVYPAAVELCDGIDNNCDSSLGGDEIDDDGDGVSECDQDCDDTDSLRFPGSLELCDGVDNDCDATTEALGGEVDADGDLVLSCLDCDDDPASGVLVFPGAPEVCNSVDDDCDGTVDVGASDESTWYFDADGDGVGGLLLTQVACAAPAGYVASSDDCAELDANSYPGAAEICDGADNDCNGLVDDGSGAAGTLWYADSDADGYGDPGSSTTACSQPVGFVTNSLDCDDGNAATNPTSYEICDGLDNNCIGGVDEAGSLDADDWYVDSDGDGFGAIGTPVSSCSQPAGYAGNAADCNDDPNNGGADIHPNASEFCNNIDDDCDGTADDGAVDASLWYVDADGDSYGHPTTSSFACTQPNGSVGTNTDCDDTESTINPGSPELCDSIDNDCNGEVDDAEAVGADQNCVASDCQEVFDATSVAAIDGDYWISPDGGAAFEAHCEHTTQDGGWTLVMNVEPNDGNQVTYTNTAFWLDDAEFGQLSSAFINDYKGPAAWRMTATNIMVQVASPGAAGAVIGWKAWSMGARTYDSFFHSSDNTIQTSAVLNSDLAAVYDYEAVIKLGTHLRSNMAHGPNTDRSRLAADTYSPHGDDNQPGLGTQMNAGCCGLNYRNRDVELWVNSSDNLWCTAPSTGSFAWIGNDGFCGGSCGSCDSNAGPAYSPYWTYRIYVR